MFLPFWLSLPDPWCQPNTPFIWLKFF